LEGCFYSYNDSKCYKKEKSCEEYVNENNETLDACVKSSQGSNLFIFI
jgi:hypothetical protein